MRFDKVIAKIKECSFLASRCRSKLIHVFCRYARHIFAIAELLRIYFQLQITKRTALMAAASRGSVELCRALLSAGSSVDDVTDHVTFKQKQLQKNKVQETRAGTHAVHEAARGAHLGVLQVIVT